MIYYVCDGCFIRSGHTHMRTPAPGCNRVRVLWFTVSVRFGSSNQFKPTKLFAGIDYRVPAGIDYRWWQPKKREGSFSAPHPRLVLTDGDLTAVELSCNRVRGVVSHPAEVLRDLLAEDGEHRLALLVAHLPAAVHRGRDDDLVLSEFHIEAGTGLEPVLDELVLVCQPY